MKFQEKIKKKYIVSTQKMKELLLNKKYSIDDTVNQNEDNTLIFYSEQKKILSTKYEIMGIYDYKCNIFSWGDSNLLTNKKISTLIKKIKKSKENIQNTIIQNEYEDNEYIERILYYIDNCMFFIQENSMIDLIQFCGYITSCMDIITSDKIINGKQYKIYYFITDILST